MVADETSAFTNFLQLSLENYGSPWIVSAIKRFQPTIERILDDKFTFISQIGLFDHQLRRNDRFGSRKMPHDEAVAMLYKKSRELISNF